MRKKTILFIRDKKLKYALPVLLLLICHVLMLNAGVNSGTEDLQQDNQLITGIVKEGIENQPLPGVAVYIKGTSIGSVTDVNGRYSIEASKNDVLIFSYVGYLDEEIPVGDQTTIDVILVTDIIGLDEVVVTGYGVQKKSDLTGAIASVSGDDLSKLPTGTFDEALKGRAAGVFSGSETGAPGSNAVIRIRGVSSINGGDPLIIIDGAPSSILAVNSLNSSDIESLEVLKDASSQAIYGASGGNGVIIITTKQGQKNKLKAEIDYYYSIQVPKNNVSMMNTEEFFSVYDSLNIPNRQRLNWPEDTIALLPDINWQEELLRNAPMQNLNLAISGGNEKSTYRFSAAYFTQKGVLPNSEYKRLSTRLNSTHQISKRIEVGENMVFSDEHYSGFRSWEYNDSWASPVGLALQMHPFVEPYVEGAGDWNNWSTSPVSGIVNPFVKIDITNRNISTYRLNGNVHVTIDIIKGLSFKSIASGGLEFGYLKVFNPTYYYDAQNNNNLSSVQIDAWRNYRWYLQQTLTYNVSLGNHNISLMAGYESEYYKNEGISGTRYDLINETEAMHYFNASLNADNIALTDRTARPLEEVATDAYFGRINWDYKGKYLITSNLRRDQSSKFGPKYRQAFFPSFSAGWKFSEENFMQNLPWISFGKIRAGWGKIGNSGLDTYRYFARVINTNVYNYPMDNVNLYSGAASHGLANPELHWEGMVSSNFGIDLAFFRNKFSFSADYFVKRNEGMIIEKPTPDLAGTYQQSPDNEGGSTQLIGNLGEVFNKGYEVTAGFKISSGDFKHNININFSYAENEVGDVGNDTIFRGSALFYQNFTFTAEGHPMGVFYGYKTDGLFQESDGEQLDDGTWLITNQPSYVTGSGMTVYAQPLAQPGDLRFVDVNGDGRLTDKDRIIIGNPHPKYLLGFSYELTYKIFDLSMFWQGAFGHDIAQISKHWFYNNTGSYNWHTDVLDRWTPENTDAEIFRLDFYDRNNNDRMSDFFIEPGDYLRLKNLQLGCTLPENIVTKLRMSTLRFYVSVKDLITITKYKGVDPEIAVNRDPIISGIDISAYPRPIVYTFGFNVSF